MDQIESYQNLKIALDIPFLNTQYYLVGIKDKVEQSRKNGNTLLYTLV